MIEIGGYNTFSDNFIEVDKSFDFKFNLARNGISFLVQAIGASKVYCPAFTCSSVKVALQNTGVDVVYYNLTESFLPNLSFCEDRAIIIVNNYFGQILPLVLKHLDKIDTNNCCVLIDNSHSFDVFNGSEFSEIFSVRKFMGVTDGAIMKIESRFVNIASTMYKELTTDRSSKRVSWLFKADEETKSSSYNEYLRFRTELQKLPLAKMSASTDLLISVVGLKKFIANRRSQFKQSLNFLKSAFSTSVFFPYLDNHLGIGIPVKVNDVALAQAELAKVSLYCAYYWPELRGVLTSEPEVELLKYLVLPVGINSASDAQLAKLHTYLV